MMLASRCGYVCRTCRSKSEKLIYHEQRRRWSDKRETQDGKQVEVDAEAGNSRSRAISQETQSSSLENGMRAGHRVVIRKHSYRKSSGPPPTENDYSVFLDSEGSKSGMRRSSDGSTRINEWRALDFRQPILELQLEDLIDLHVERAGGAECNKKTRRRYGGNSNAASPHNLGAAVGWKGNTPEVDTDSNGQSAHRTPPQASSTKAPLQDRAASVQRQRHSIVTAAAWRSTPISNFAPSSRSFHSLQARQLHTSNFRLQQSIDAAEVHGFSDDLSLPPPTSATGGIRAHLRRWQELHGEDEDPVPVTPQDDVQVGDAPYNDFARLPDEARMRVQAQKDELEAQDEAAAAFIAASGKEGYDGSSAVEDARFLVPGDLVEIEFTRSEKEPLLGIYIRPVGVTGNYAQFLTMQGKWLHQSERSVQYRLKGFADTETLNRIIPYLPNPETMAEIQAVSDRAYTEDLSVPREVAAPLIARMVKFHDESQEIYRLHANSLDDAHSILAHETDLWYGTLVSAATTLLKMPAASLPQAAVFAVRKALVHAGFAFNMDRRSHRQTGFFQIRSKAQVKNVEQVRHWIRQWQDDLAKTAGLSKQERSQHFPSKGAKYVYSFIKKSKAIVMESRKTRQPTESHNVGISKVRIPLTEDTDCVKITAGNEFTDEEGEILRFMEAWACTNMFLGLPRIESLPPLLLHATGLYPDTALGQNIGFMFLQELGTLLPYENRVRFDQHLLLPSSQHSKPLHNLMNKLMTMRDSHNFEDSMSGLRHDWKDLPVYCIDGAEAHEIDDGISLESAGKGADGKEEHWVHIHIANPTAFFDRNHPLAKMARHMGETIYMPERAYVMLPRWATQRHFSLAPDRPCLTFSAKLDSDGKTLEKKITPGIIRNVISLTPDEIESLIGENSLEAKLPMKTYSVGGTPPPPKNRKSPLSDMQKQNIIQLSTLNELAARRAGIRKSAGGMFFDAHKPEVKVWQSSKHNGLAWDHPHRKGSRIVEGDPIIQLKTRGLSNWFEPSANAVDVLVREFMLLACEIAASWCAEREIPIIYRGTTTSRQSELERERFVKDQLAPNTAADGTYPMWLGVQYLRTIGFTALRTEPIRHGFLGMEYYSKVTSPLRRYGDMILHWQIEAALRHEASTGESLIVSKRGAGKRKREVALPFSKAALESIMLGLQPREQIVSRSQSYADTFWCTMLLFRKHNFGEDGGFEGFPTRELPVRDQTRKRGLASQDASSKELVEKEEVRMEKVPIFTAFVSNRPDLHGGAPYLPCYLTEFNITASMIPPPVEEGVEVQLGDLWECRIEQVDMFKRIIVMRALGLVKRLAL